MSHFCRTCLSEITSNRYVDINLPEFARKQLTLCIPELDCDLVLKPVLCMKCVEALNAVCDFKSCCLQTEQRIQAYMQTLTIERQNIELHAVLGNYNGINSMAMYCDNDINDLNTIHDHSRTMQDLDYKDAKEECSVTSESCYEMSFDDCVEVNNDSLKKESITIEEHELDIKSEMLDTGRDAEIGWSLRQWSEVENGNNLKLQDCNRSTQKQDFDSNYQLESIKTELDTVSNVAVMQSECKDASAVVKDALADCIFLPEPSNSDDFEEHNKSSQKNSTISSGLLRQYNKLDPTNYNSNVENCNSSTTCAESFTKQGTCVTKSQVGVVSMAPMNSSSSGQHKVNATKIPDLANIHSIKRRFKSSIKSHSRINQHCKHANRQVLNNCHQKGKNITEKIVAKSERHSELLRDCRVVSTRMDFDNYPVMNNVKTHVNKSSYLKCDMNMKSNNTAATVTQAEADLNSLIDASLLHLKQSNTAALNSSNAFTNVSLQHFVNSNNLSVQVKKPGLRISSKLLNTIGKNPYKSVRSDNACSTKSILMVQMRKNTGEKPYKCDQCDYACPQKSRLIRHIRKHTGEKPYKCDQCDYACSDKGNLMVHMRNHAGEKPYKCDQCDYACSRKNDLMKHIRRHTGEKPYKCDQCDYASSGRSNLITHMRNHTGEKPYKCDQCDYAVSTKSDLMRHLKKHTGEKPYKCNQCDYACSQSSNLMVHRRNHAGEKPYKCNICGYGSPQKINLERHLRTHTGEKPYKCNICGYGSSQKIQLKIHLRTHTGEKPYKCDQCDYACPQKSRLIRHIRKHTGEKPYKCDQCDYACSDKGNLMVHMRNHTGEKPYKCDQCDYAVSTKSDLMRHLKKHTGEKPYKCNQCDYACSQSSNLMVHRRNHAGEKPYKCNICGYGSPQKINLERHLRTHTGEKPYKCDQCDYAFSTKSDLMRHLKKHTGEKPYKCNQCDYACSQKSNLMVHRRNHAGEKPYKCNICGYGSSQKIHLERHLRTHTGEKPYKCAHCDYACSKKKPY